MILWQICEAHLICVLKYFVDPHADSLECTRLIVEYIQAKESLQCAENMITSNLDKHNMSALQIAIDCRSTEMISLLLSYLTEMFV